MVYPFLDIMVPNRMCMDWYCILFSCIIYFQFLHGIFLVPFMTFCNWSLQVQLNLMEPPHDSYYVNQQSMQGLVSQNNVVTVISKDSL